MSEEGIVAKNKYLGCSVYSNTDDLRPEIDKHIRASSE
jgi:hypothetical protein